MSEMVGREYVPVAENPDPTADQAKTVLGLRESYDWTEVSHLADGTVEIAVLDFRGIIERIITVFADGTTTAIA